MGRVVGMPPHIGHQYSSVGKWLWCCTVGFDRQVPIGPVVDAEAPNQISTSGKKTRHKGRVKSLSSRNARERFESRGLLDARLQCSGRQRRRFVRWRTDRLLMNKYID